MSNIEQVPFDEIKINRELLIEGIAAACHMQNRTYCLEVMGDDSQPIWRHAPSWMKDSVIDGVKHALVNQDPAASHRNWLEKKRVEGWTYGETKDPDAKTHPCMVPFGDLPPDQQRKDELFVMMVEQMGLALGLIRYNSTSQT